MSRRVLVAVPAYNCSLQISRVIRQFQEAPSLLYDELVVIDNCSTDATVQVAADEIAARPDLRASVLRNRENYGLGGSHKVAFGYASAQGFDGLVILHGDDQGRLADFNPVISSLRSRELDCVLGARFMEGSELTGYPLLRVLGNRAFNRLYSMVTRTRVYDMGSGLNYFDRILLEDEFYLRMPDDLTFNNAYLLAMIAAGKHIRFAPISWREEDQVSNAKLWSQSVKLLHYLAVFARHRSRLLSADFRATKRESYPFSVVASTSL